MAFFLVGFLCGVLACAIRAASRQAESEWLAEAPLRIEPSADRQEVFEYGLAIGREVGRAEGRRWGTTP